MAVSADRLPVVTYRPDALDLDRLKEARCRDAQSDGCQARGTADDLVRALDDAAFASAVRALAGSLLAHHDEVIVGSRFDFQLALLFVLMTVVGGLRNRVGVVIASAVFALLGSGRLVTMLHLEGFFENTIGLPVEFVALVVGPILLLLVLTVYPGGVGQQVAPIREWLTGRRFDIRAGRVEEVTITDVRA
jgi:branched-chain amino acid transport system permease protein